MTQPALGQDSMASEILAAHNQYRSEVGVEPLAWSDTLIVAECPQEL